MDGMENKRMGSRRKELIAPCKGCEKRVPGCHDGCEGYLEFRRQNEIKRRYEAEYMSHSVYDPLAPKRKRDL